MNSFDQYILEPWWQVYSKFSTTNEGNIRKVKDWKPRQGVVYYAIFLFIILIFTSFVITLYISHFVSSLLSCSILLLVMFTSGFAYTNYVTSDRTTFFIGKHGTYRDIIIILFFIFPILYIDIYIPGFHLVLFPNNKPFSLTISTLYSHSSLLLGYYLGLHVLYLTRPGSILSGSFALSNKSSAFSLLKDLGFILKLGFILLNIHFHFMWCASRNELLFGIFLWHTPWVIITFLAFIYRKKYYLHLHHWFLGLILMRAAQQGNPHNDLFLTGLAASQFIEGASRWSIAPLFHKREEEKRDKKEK